MLHFPESGVREAGVPVAEGQGGGAGFIDFDRIFAIARRQIWIIVAGVVIGAFLGVAYLMTAVPLYTATSNILIDKGQSKLVDELASASGVFQDEAEMLSQVELLKSDQIARAVATRLNLPDNPTFMAGTPSVRGMLVGSLKGIASSVLTDLDSDIDAVPPTFDDAVAILLGGLDVQRVGQTYVLQLQYTSTNPELSARIAAAYGDAYLDDQLQAKYEATRRASGWLQDRIAELKQQSYDADLAVQNFRNENGLIVSSARGSGDVLISQQQLGEITTQLVTAETNTAAAKAKLDQIRSIVATGDTNAVVGDALSSSTINSLRERYLDSSRRETEISQKLGQNHAQAVRLRNEMAEYQRLIFGELGRIADSYQNEYQVAVGREQSLRASLDKIVNVNAGDNTTQVRLRELEREAGTFQSLYNNFLQRYQQTVQQQSFPITDARVISPPAVPKRPSAPKKPMILALAMALGLAAASGLAGLREYRERFFRVGNQVRSELETEFLGYAPLVSGAMDGQGEGGEGGFASRLWAQDAMPTFVTRKPLSSFAETMRSVKVAADIAMPDIKSKVIGVVSCVPSEGKTTVSSNLAQMFAMQGGRTLLIDGDLRNPGLTRSLSRRPDKGLVELALGQVEPSDVWLWESGDKLAVIPTVLKRRVANTSELLASGTVAGHLAQFRSEFDYILVDLPPLGPVVDAKAFAKRVDAFVLVIEWGRTSRQLARSVMANNPALQNKCLGVVLNKVDSRKMKLYQSYGSPEYYAKRYESYYRN